MVSERLNLSQNECVVLLHTIHTWICRIIWPHWPQKWLHQKLIYSFLTLKMWYRLFRIRVSHYFFNDPKWTTNFCCFVQFLYTNYSDTKKKNKCCTFFRNSFPLFLVLRHIFYLCVLVNFSFHFFFYRLKKITVRCDWGFGLKFL